MLRLTVNQTILLLLSGLSLLATAPAFGQICTLGDQPFPRRDDMIFFSTIPGYPTMVAAMETRIRDQFHGDQDGPLIDTACCYEPDIFISESISLPAGCNIITDANVLSCFDALGANKVAIVEECSVGGLSAAVCTHTGSNSSFLARVNPFGTPDDPDFWSTIYLRNYLITQFGWDFVVGNPNGNLFHSGLTWDGRLALNECSTVLPLGNIIAGELCFCHNGTGTPPGDQQLTSIASALPNGAGCNPRREFLPEWSL